MHVKALSSPRKHTCSRPLVGPEANLRENAFVPSYKFAKKPTLPLRVNFSRENFYAWNPSFLNLLLAPIRPCQFPCVDTSLRKLLSKRCNAVILSVEGAS